jgi:hypothetical protein
MVNISHLSCINNWYIIYWVNSLFWFCVTTPSVSKMTREQQLTPISLFYRRYFVGWLQILAVPNCF